jgi:poly(A) polymerase
MLAVMTSLTAEQQRALSTLVKASPFAKVSQELGRRFAAAGHELYLVGGTVRDALLERSSPDVDFTTDASPEQILAVVRGWDDGTWLQGARYGTVGVRKGDFRLEITTFRSDVYR